MNQFVSPKKIYHGEGSLSKLDEIIRESKVTKGIFAYRPDFKRIRCDTASLTNFRKGKNPRSYEY